MFFKKSLIFYLSSSSLLSNYSILNTSRRFSTAISMNEYRSLSSTSTVCYEEIINKSKFISCLVSVRNEEEIKKKLMQIQEKYPNATHYCYAYQLLQTPDINSDSITNLLLASEKENVSDKLTISSNSPNFSISAYSSDDGEPHGTAGPPILKNLQGKNIINSLLVVVRYFGGTKLGKPGLIRAYNLMSKEVIKLVDNIEEKDSKSNKNINQLIQFEIKVSLQLFFPYDKYNNIMKLIPRFNIEELEDDEEVELDEDNISEEEKIKLLKKQQIEKELEDIKDDHNNPIYFLNKNLLIPYSNLFLFYNETQRICDKHIKFIIN